MEVKVLPTRFDQFDFEPDRQRTGDVPARLKRFSPQYQNSSLRSSPDGERIAAMLWFRSRVSRIANSKGSYSSREKDHA